MAGTCWRQELFCKSTQQLRELIPFIESNRFSGVNLPNKAKGELHSLLERARLLSASLPGTEVCVHYSINANYQRAPEAAFAELTDFARQLAAIDRCSLLLVSGGGPRKRLNTLTALEQVAGSPEWCHLRLPLAVAFNPYFPDEERQQEERQRLRRKLLAGQGRVVAVYLQAGSDVQRLREGLRFLRQLLAEVEPQLGTSQQDAQDPVQQCAAPERAGKRQRHNPEQGQREGCRDATAAANRQRLQNGMGQQQQQGIAVYGSVFVPSKKLLAAMRFRPWGGVFLSEQYLSGVEAADAITSQLLRTYAEFSVAPLIETEVARAAEVEQVRRLLQAGADVK